MSYAELSGWVSYLALEPTASERIDVGFAQLMSLHANINRDSEKRQEPFTAADFMPYWTKKAPKASEPEDDDGMAPERVMKVMEHAMRAQEVERVAQAARRRAAERAKGR